MAARWRCSLSLSPPTLVALDVRIYATASTSFRLLAIDLALICISSLRKIYNLSLQGKLSRRDPRSHPPASAIAAGSKSPMPGGGGGGRGGGGFGGRDDTRSQYGVRWGAVPSRTAELIGFWLRRRFLRG